jgi:hypothetical protein
MLDAIRGKEWDRKRTETVEALLATALERAPTLHARELECGSRFCRAVFADQSGITPELRPLFGAPPFDGDGYTLPNPDGSAEIYFMRVGESLQALREEAMK